MANNNVILLKSVNISNLNKITLVKGELLIAWNNDESKANLYVGNTNGDKIILFQNIE